MTRILSLRDDCMMYKKSLLSRLVGAVLVALWMGLGGLSARAQSTASVAPLIPSTIVTADSLFFAMDPVAALGRLEVRLEVAPTDYEARWRAARAALALGVMTDARDMKSAYLRRSSFHAEAAVGLRPSDPDAISWLAAAKGRIAIDISGVRDQVRLGQQVWELTQQLLKLDPQHPLGNDVLGKLNQEVRKLSGFQRFVARTFMSGGAPMKGSSWEGAEEHLQRAIAADPTVVLFHLDLGETYQLQGKTDLARAAFEAGLKVPDLYPTDPKFKEAIVRRLEALGR